MLARSLAKSVSAKFGQVQVTLDLLPTDVTGLKFFDQREHVVPALTPSGELYLERPQGDYRSGSGGWGIWAGTGVVPIC